MKIYRNVYRKNLSITNIALRNSDLSIIGIAQIFLKLSTIVIAVVQKGLSCPSLTTAAFAR